MFENPIYLFPYLNLEDLYVTPEYKQEVIHFTIIKAVTLDFPSETISSLTLWGRVDFERTVLSLILWQHIQFSLMEGFS